ncbi:hypothetical protein K0W35_001189 [Vibrio parahaemolyticus]|nr:hypothetical protein [Vibrio parahaemolyticus]
MGMKNTATANFALVKTLSTGRLYHCEFVKLGIGITGAIMLSQACCISAMEATIERNGWFHKTAKDWEIETGLTRREQETARKKLVGCGVLIEKKQGIPCKTWSLINSDRLIELLHEIRSKECDS